MARDIAFEKKVNDALTSAVIYVDTAWGGDGASESGLYRVILDAYFTGLGRLKSNPVYKDKAGKEIRLLSRGGKEFPEQSKKWIGNGKWSDSIDILADVADTIENPRRKKYLYGQVGALMMLLEIKRSELGLARAPSYGEVVRTCVGAEPEMIDIKPLQGLLGEQLAGQGYRQKNLHEALDAWAKDQKIITNDEIGKHIRMSIKPLEKAVRKRIMPLLPERVNNVPLDHIKITGVKEAFFAASNNYLGNRDGATFLSGYEYNMKITKSEPELLTMTMHEFLPGHHMQSVINQALWERNLAGAESAITTMGTPQTALAEGIAVAAPYILTKCGDGLEKSYKIAMLRDQLDAAGRLNGSMLKFQKKKSSERVREYVREECCFNEEWSKRYVEKWLNNPFLGQIYAPGYGLGNKAVKEALILLPIEEFIPLLYGVYGPMDLITFKDAVSEARPAATD